MDRPSRVLLVLLLITAPVCGQRNKRGSQQSTSAAGAYNLPAVTFTGVLKEISGKEIIIDSSEGQAVTIFRNHKTRFLQAGQSVNPNKILVGAKLTLDVAKNPDGSLQAVNVMVAP